MPFVIAAPEMVTTAATNLAGLGTAIQTANAIAAAPTSAVLAAGADEVSTALAALFGTHARAYQAVSTEAATFHERFVQAQHVQNGPRACSGVAHDRRTLR